MLVRPLFAIVAYFLFGFAPPKGAQALECWTCEGRCGCRSPQLEVCSPHTKCYTISSLLGNHVLRKGCSQDCLDVDVYNQNCRMCRSELCNNEQSLMPMSGVDECGPMEPAAQYPKGRDERGYSVGQGTNAGGGYGVDAGYGGVGSGVVSGPRPNSVQQPGPPQQANSPNSGYYGQQGRGGDGSFYAGGDSTGIMPQPYGGRGGSTPNGGGLYPYPQPGPPPSPPQQFHPNPQQRGPNGGHHYGSPGPYGGVGTGTYYNGSPVPYSHAEKFMTVVIGLVGLLITGKIVA